MKLGISLFLLRPERLAPVAVAAEALGFESVWVAEHLVFPAEIRSRYPYAAGGIAPVNPATPLLDPLLVLAQIAGLTSRIRLGTNVYLPPLRHPLAVARLVTTLDVLSGGRLSLGVGAGWLEEEFEAVAVPFARRGALLRESVRAIRTLFTEEVPEVRGRTWSFGPVRFEPKPVQKPGPPFLFGGESEAALRRAAEMGDGWYGVGHEPVSAAGRVTELRSLLEKAGRRAAPFEITVSVGAHPVDRDSLARYRDAGVDRVVALPWRRGSEAESALERLATAAGL